MPHPVVAAFEAMLDAVDACARLEPSCIFLLDVGPTGPRMGVVDDDDNALPLSDAPLSGHQRLALLQASVPLLIAAHAWHLACESMPGFPPFVGTGRLTFTHEDDDLQLSWSFCNTDLPVGDIETDYPYEPARDHLTGCLERACAVARATPSPSCQMLTVFEPHTMQAKGPFFSTVPLVEALLPMAYTFEDPSEIAYVGGPVVPVSLQEARDHAAQANLRPTSEAARRFESLAQDLVALCVHRPLESLRGIRISAKAEPCLDVAARSAPRITTDVQGLFDGPTDLARHLFPEAARSLDAAPSDGDAPEGICSEQDLAWARRVVQAWRDAVDALPKDGQWIQHGLSAALMCNSLPEHARGNALKFVLFGPTGWTTPRSLTPWTVRSSGERFLVRAWNAPMGHGMRVDAPDAATAAAVALTSYGEGREKGAKGFDVWPLVGVLHA